MKRLIKFLNDIADNLYLWCSDCDGMCEHCNTELKCKCNKHKNK